MNNNLPTFTPTKFADKEINDIVKKGGVEGKFCSKLREPVPRFQNAQCEKVITQTNVINPSSGKAENNCFIVLGRDRSSGLYTGCGGEGMSSCGMIDLVVGRYAINSAFEIKKTGKPIGSDELVGPNFVTDAARVYITQKALNIDEYFGITNTSDGIENKSAVAMKADNIRVFARNTIRLFCGGTQNCEGLPKTGEPTSTGGPLAKPKIELVIGDEKLLQPAVLGTNLLNYLNLVENEFTKIKLDLGAIVEQLAAINSAVGILTMGSPVFLRNMVENIDQWSKQIIDNINSKLRSLDSLNGLGVIPGKNSITSQSVYIT